MKPKLIGFDIYFINEKYLSYCLSREFQSSISCSEITEIVSFHGWKLSLCLIKHSAIKM